MAAETKVVNVKVSHLRPEYSNLQQWMEDPSNVYIGRGGIVFIDSGEGKERFPKKASVWANPYKVKKDNSNRDTILVDYEEYIRGKLLSGELTVDELKALKGKNLGCWCKPERCHGDVLLKLIEEYSCDE